MEDNIPEIFLAFKSYLKKDQDLREEIRDVVKNMEQCAREMIAILEIIHKNGSGEEICSSCKLCRTIIERDIKTGYAKLCPLIGNDYYRYHSSWRYVSQIIVYIIALVVFLESGTLVSYNDVAEILGIGVCEETGFCLDLEDYLMGLLQLPSELSRLAVNSVVNGDYKKPLQISQFVTELNAGFRLLNLKNDILRKKFDSLKYEIKKIEEVVYDISIRGLRQNEDEK